MASTEKLGDLNDNLGKENAKNTANTEKLGDVKSNSGKEKSKNMSHNEKLGSSQGKLAKLKEWYAKNKKIIDIVLLSLLGVILLLVIYFYWLAPKWNKAASEEFQSVVTETKFLQGSMMTSDSATLVKANEQIQDIITDYDHFLLKTARSAKFSLKYYSALCYLKLGQEDEALEMLLSMKKRDDYLWYEGQMLIGDLYDDQDDADNAKKYYEKAAKGETSFVAPIALWKLGMLYEREGDWDSAYDNYEKIKEEYPERYAGMGVAKYYERAKIKAGK